MSSHEPAFLRLLHLEDNPLDAELLANALKREWPACQILRVTSRQEFEAALQQQMVDVILSDFTVAGFDGISALNLTRTLRPELPFIFLSGTMGEEKAVETLKRGATDYVLKDRPARLVPSIRRALRDAAMHRSHEIAEAAIRASEEKFSKAFRAVPDAVLITELASGRVVDINEGCERLYGYKREECVGKTTSDLGVWLDPAGREQLLTTLQQEGGVVRNMEVQGRMRSGRIVDTLVSCEPIELHGRPHLVTIIHDVTEQKRAARALTESEAKFTQAFRASPWAVGLTDFETRKFVEVNESYCRMFGYAHDEMIGRTAAELGLWNDLQERDRFMQAFVRLGSVPEMEVAGRRRDGTTIICLLRGEKVEVGGRVHIVSALYDITTRRQMEKARAALEAQLRQSQKLDALGQLAGGIAHDFNNILTGIMAFTGFAVADAGNPTAVREHLAAVLKACDRATALVRQILTFSRHQPVERKPVRLDVVVHEAMKLLRVSLSKSIEVDERLDPAAPLVLADSTQIHQVILNLGTNAAYAMRGRPGRLTVHLDSIEVGAGTSGETAKLESGRYARITIGDNGHGMDADTLAHIFDPFFTTKPAGEGTGLGLAVVRGIMEDHDGSISVESRVGEGTHFTLLFPENSAAALTEEVSYPELFRGAGQQILLIDDDLTVGTAAAELLRRFDYQLTFHNDPRNAWAEFDALPSSYDAVVMDMTMPHLSGVELAGRMLSRRPDLPIVMVTGLINGGWTVERLRNLGIRSLVFKPVSAAKLLGALHEVLKP